MVDEEETVMSAFATKPARTRLKAIARGLIVALVVMVIALVAAGIALWNWPTGFYTLSTFIGRVVCAVHLESIVVNGKEVPTLTNGGNARADDANPPPLPILFLHGYGTSKEAMMAEMRWFSQSRQVITPDLPGFGDNPLAPGEAALTGGQYVQWIESFRIAANLSQVDVVGESMGGALAAAYAATYPKSVRRIVLQSPAGLKPPRMNSLMSALEQGENPLDVRSEDDFDNVLQLCFVHPPMVPSPIRTYLTNHSAARVAKHPEMLPVLGPFLVGGVAPLLASIVAPTLIIYGDQDQITDCSMLPVYVDGIRGAEGLLIRGAGHVVFSDAPNEVRAAITEFLDDPARR
ncbi:MAG: alpha/beta hydrolase [Phycisphaerales bacterium]|nr:alpha/beta hydrolase [Phycisphaerales bacterium]